MALAVGMGKNANILAPKSVIREAGIWLFGNWLIEPLEGLYVAGS